MIYVCIYDILAIINTSWKKKKKKEDRKVLLKLLLTRAKKGKEIDGS